MHCRASCNTSQVWSPELERLHTVQPSPTRQIQYLENHMYLKRTCKTLVAILAGGMRTHPYEASHHRRNTRGVGNVAIELYCAPV
jgi:hypothetical protein